LPASAQRKWRQHKPARSMIKAKLGRQSIAQPVEEISARSLAHQPAYTKTGSFEGIGD
jgi:hypothetical protein